MDLRQRPFGGVVFYHPVVLGFYTGIPLEQHGRRRIRYGRRWLSEYYAGYHRDTENFRSLAHFCEVKAPKHVCFHRTYALGDILMLLPAARAFARHYPCIRRITIACGSYRERLAGFHKTQDLIRFQVCLGNPLHYDYGADVHMDLNSCLEVDHRGGPDSSIHRVNLYLRAMGAWHEP